MCYVFVGRTVTRPPSGVSEHQSEPQPTVKFEDKPEQIELEEQISIGCTTPFHFLFPNAQPHTQFQNRKYANS